MRTASAPLGIARATLRTACASLPLGFATLRVRGAGRRSDYAETRKRPEPRFSLHDNLAWHSDSCSLKIEGVGAFEDRIVASMVALCEQEPECGRAMFVLPTCHMVMTGPRWADGLRVMRHGDVEMVCRAPECEE